MNKITALASLAALLASNTSMAIPLDPSESNIAQYFSVDMQDKYYLYADSEDPKLVWYIPKTGFVASKGRGDRIAPYFNASETIPNFGIWPVLRPGQSQVRLGGAFNTTGDIESLKILEEEAKSVLGGVNIAPAIAKRAKATFVAEGIDIDGDNRVDVNCVPESHEIDGVNVVINVCSVVAADGSSINTSTLERAYFKTPSGRSSVSTRIPFQILSLPDSDISFDIVDILLNGNSLDQYFQFVVDWELDTGSTTRVARITIDWNQTFQQASTFTAIHYNSCLEVEIQTFFKKLVQEGEGIVVEYLWPDGSYRPEAPNNEEFIKVVDGVREELQDELFDQVREYSTPVLGQVSTDVNSFFTLRANYEKQILERHETRYVNWNPGMSIETAQTNMGIDCVMGGFGDRVEWNPSPECQAVIGDITSSND